MYVLAILEAWEVRCWQGHTPSEGSREESLIAFPRVWGSQVFLGIWQHDSNLYHCLHIAVFSLGLQYLCLNLPLLIKALIIGLGPILL